MQGDFFGWRGVPESVYSDLTRGEETLQESHTNAPAGGAFAGGLGNLAIALILWLLAAPAFAAEREAAPRLALLIGVDAYEKGWPRKRNAVRDAKLVASEFLRHGYKVALLENPDSRRLHRALKEFFLIDGERADARLFVWFSGHVHTVGGRSFLVPADAPLPRHEADFASLSFALDDYAELLRRAPAAQVYTVIDGPVAAIDFETRPDPTRNPFAVDLPALFDGAAAPAIVMADLGAKGIYYRIRISGFADSRKAGDFCTAFRGGGRDCFLVPEP